MIQIFKKSPHRNLSLISRIVSGLCLHGVCLRSLTQVFNKASQEILSFGQFSQNEILDINDDGLRKLCLEKRCKFRGQLSI